MFDENQTEATAGLMGLTVTQLDELADANDVADYPKNGTKPEKVEVLEAAGIEAAPLPPLVEFELAEDVNRVEFAVQGFDAHVVVDEDGFATRDPQLIAALESHPDLVRADA